MHQKIPQKKLDERTFTAWKEIQRRINTSKNKAKVQEKEGRERKGRKGGRGRRREGAGREGGQNREERTKSKEGRRGRKKEKIGGSTQLL